MPFEIGADLQDFFRSASSATQSILLVAGAFLLAVAAHYVSLGARRLSKFLITGQHVPFKYVFRNQKRSLVLSDLTIDLFKYGVYLFALYVILSQAGVSSSAYLAGLFLLGLAFAFGSQGVVQDLVNGFFVRLDGLFDVGDMVEMAGQVGRVEELNARTTTLRNYLGEKIVVPNRNIEQIGTFPRGYMTAYVDVPVPSNAGDDIKELVRNTARRLQKQFNAVVLGSPEILGFVRVGEDELYIRVSFRIWPQERWVVEREFINRICAAFGERNIPIPKEQMSVYFRVGTQPSQTRTRGRRRLMRRVQ
jgi:small conductance mechanosensitive channel